MVAAQVSIPLSTIAIRNVQPGQMINFNVFVREANKTLTRVYRIMTVDKVNEIAVCKLIRETEVRV